jgi:hypothetical protein
MRSVVLVRTCVLVWAYEVSYRSMSPYQVAVAMKVEEFYYVYLLII